MYKAASINFNNITYAKKEYIKSTKQNPWFVEICHISKSYK